MWQKVRTIFLNDRFILSIILLNSVLIYLQVSGVTNFVLDILDTACTLIFLAEMLVKHREYGLEGYWKDGWNRLDGILVILSLPSIAALFIPNDMEGLSIFLIFRLLRVLRFFRVLHFFPNFGKVVLGFKRAMRDSYAILLSFFVIIVIFGLLNCSLFSYADPAHFGTPLKSIYAVFQICTVEGWYEIPNAISDYYGGTTIAAEFVRLYFCALLIFGGIIGMSFINSIFVDAMMSDNNDDLVAHIDEMRKSLDEMKKQLDALQKKD
jgi:voltage-gated sodium channel